MSTDYVTPMSTFTEDTLPDLDEVVLAGLQYLSTADIPHINTGEYTRPLVIGSVNALSTGRVLFSTVDAVFAEESTYAEALARTTQIDAIYIISASGGKHAVSIARDLHRSNLPVFLITNNPEAKAREHVDASRVLVFPHLREPYTYNTSTYMSMMRGVGEESLSDILSFIESEVAPAIPKDVGGHQSFILTVRPEFSVLRSMFETKFDELFGSLRYGRAFTSEELKHAKTVIQVPSECFLDFSSGVVLPESACRTVIPLPKDCGPIAMLAIGYYVIGVIQKQNPPFFKDNIKAYVKEASGLFGEEISVIVS